MPHTKESLSKTEILKLQLHTLFPHFMEFSDVSTNHKEIVPYIVLDAIIQYCIKRDKSIQQEEIKRGIEDAILSNFKKYPIEKRIEPRKLRIIDTLINNLEVTPDPTIEVFEVNLQSYEVFDYRYNRGWNSRRVAKKLNITLALVDYRYAVAINYLLHLLAGLNEIKGRPNIRTIEYVLLQQIV